MNADKHLNDLEQKKFKKIRGGFVAADKTMYLRKGATRFEIMHELEHAKDFVRRGFTNYNNQTEWAKELTVFKALMKQQHKFNQLEIDDAHRYIEDLARKYNAKDWE
ncbi:hypothetical protein K6Y31_21555 [Motilimonas cestriensis]|uniref:Tox-MPTase4 domain-containing protein n=1 Tax=Motilimonas cestriensis TaxID=2742685 RepID=A0ABS8WG76_9GAMM|nr:zincin-like metallopeptidase toxin domain-containing protein [Motilimonas cestriensis]MCE2597362.1 hypothetical protein [Motilimonas cestriensis]